MRPDDNEQPKMSWMIQLILLVVALVLPFGVLCDRIAGSMTAMTWSIPFRTDPPTVGWFIHVLPFATILQSLPFTFPRLMVPYEVGRLYHQKTTRKRVFIFAILGDLSLAIYALLVTLPVLFTPFYPYVVIGIPLPFLVLTLWLLLKKYPPKASDEWLEAS